MIIYPDEMFAVIVWEKGEGDLFAAFQSKEHADGMRGDLIRNLGYSAGVVTVLRVAIKVDDARWTE